MALQGHTKGSGSFSFFMVFLRNRLGQLPTTQNSRKKSTSKQTLVQSFSRTFLALTPGCPWGHKVSPHHGHRKKTRSWADVHDFRTDPKNRTGSWKTLPNTNSLFSFTRRSKFCMTCTGYFDQEARKGVLAKVASAESSVTVSRTRNKNTRGFWAQQYWKRYSQKRSLFLQEPPSKTPPFLALDLRVVTFCPLGSWKSYQQEASITSF